ncbi:MAG: hypothetical protein KDA66_14050, partial [Planctomycetaceae bacterium]|nr:hypothetical protein [Planctomycetaceae bacterium]
LVSELTRLRVEVLLEDDFAIYGDSVVGGGHPMTHILPNRELESQLDNSSIHGLVFSEFSNADAYSDDDAELIRSLENISFLVLDETAAGNVTCEMICRMPRLQYLALSGTQVTDKGLMELVSLPRLHVVDVFGSKVTHEGIERFKKARPDVVVFNWYH